MQGFRAKCRVAVLVIIAAWIGLGALYGLLRPVPNGCIMTYMYPTYIPISTPANVSSAKYGLFLYHEGWKKIDFKEHLQKLNGIPVLFIPGNGGSYKQVRSLAAESDRAYQGGPLERMFYNEASLNTDEGGGNMDVNGLSLPNQYTRMLDWFAVDLEEEHSAMDGRIIEEHTEYVVHAIHRILDQYKEFHVARSKGGETTGNLPRSVILVGHSMGGFVARAAIVHPHLRKSAVETVLTLSSPHKYPPVALQPSLGQYFAHVNEEWRKGYEVHTHEGNWVSEPALSHVVVVSISGGIRDYQVRSKFESLDGLVPPTHGFMLGSTSMKNVWLSMEHQAILWCNQLVVQVSHTLLSLVDSETGQPYLSPKKRISVFTSMLQSGISQSFKWMKRSQSSELSNRVMNDNEKDIAGSKVQILSPCPRSVHWSDDGLERDLYIQTTTVTVLAMDGRRRWLDIQKLGSNGKGHFMFVTNLAPCSGVRLHLWPEKGKTTSEIPPSKGVLEVTTKMVSIPAGPAPRQIEPGGQTEQAPPSAVILLGPDDMHGFRFLTISVAPRPTVSGRPPPAASMGVGQFYNPEEGEQELSAWALLRSAFSQEELLLKEDHPLALNLSFSVSLGLLPVALSVKTLGCGIKKSGLPDEEAGDLDHSKLCKLRCFPPVAFAWDTTSDLHIIPNLYSETIVVDSAPALWDSTQGSDRSTVLLLVDPHCSYKITAAVSLTSSASRFLLLYCSQMVGFSIAVMFFALMRQAHAWELDLPLPSLLEAVESNLRMPSSFLLLAIVPILISLVVSLLTSQPFPPLTNFIIVSIICYAFANGVVILLILISQFVLYLAAILHVFIRIRWQALDENFHFTFSRRFLRFFSSFFSFKALRIIGGNTTLVTALVASTFVCFVHPALGLLILLLSHVVKCHSALYSVFAASFRSHARRKEFDAKINGNDVSEQLNYRSGGGFNPLLPLEENFPHSPHTAKSFGDTQLEIFNYWHGLLMLHLLAALMFVPSLFSWLQRFGMGESFPWFLDSALCIGVILHGLCWSNPGFNSLSFAFSGIWGQEVGLSFIYLFAGYYSYLVGLALAPYKTFYAMAFIGAISLTLRIIERRSRVRGEGYFRTRRHSHRH
ncbi:uncharacterized protein LOC122076467 isoform X1 [Macadamia integrifolia]|uniref:uncharacterized protein LOC122076467 isoform X1 n=1 Tax=Macadamia integrifolia TaxID=60698 RepID=UPI001C501D9A|nr:uncharacterized protein LOC122076467 isoform X1 [Macadamia integrifolia]